MKLKICGNFRKFYPDIIDKIMNRPIKLNYDKGSFVDFWNQFGHWIPTKVLTINPNTETIEISSSLGKNDSIKLNMFSNRIAPFRSFTRPYEKYDKLDYTLEKYIKVKIILFKVSEYIQTDFFNKYQNDFIALNYKKGEIFYVIASSFTSNINPDLIWEIVENFIQFYKKYISEFSKNYIESNIQVAENYLKFYEGMEYAIASFFLDFSEIICMILGKSKDFVNFIIV